MPQQATPPAATVHVVDDDDAVRASITFMLDRVGVTAEAYCYKTTRSIGFVRADAWDDDAEKSDKDEATASVRFRIQAADDPNIAAAAIARFFSPED